jgi:hypothetical protein
LAGCDGFAKAADHEQGVIDAKAEAKHGGEILNEDGEVEALGEEAGNGERDGDGELADGEGDDGGDKASEGEEEESEGGGDDEAFGAVNVVGAGFADVEVEGKLAGELELDGGVAGAELVGKSEGALVELGDERLDWSTSGGESDEDEGAAVAAEEEGVAEVLIGDDAGDAGLGAQGGDDGLEGLRAGVGVGGREALDDEDDLVDEGGVEAGDELFANGLGLAAFNAGCGFEVAFGMEGEGDQREGRYEDEPGDPKAAQKHESYDVIQGGHELSGCI